MSIDFYKISVIFIKNLIIWHKKEAPTLKSRPFKLKFFENVVNLHKVDIRILLKRNVQILVPSLMELSMAIRTQKSRPLEFRGEPVTNEINVVDLQFAFTSTNITRRILRHENFFDTLTSATKMFACLFHATTSLKVG